MRVAVAGSTGAVGRPLVRMLRAAGHEVVELSRRKGVDVLDTDAVRRALTPTPEVVVQQLTALPRRYEKQAMMRGLEQTNRLRVEGTGNLRNAAPGARLISQSICFAYKPRAELHDEDDPLWTDGPVPLPLTTAALLEMERLTVDTGGVVLRYGLFYGPGTWYAPDGAIAAMVRKRRLPIVGGRGVTSFCHVEDAAGAVLAVLDRGAGIYNVCDDEPAPALEWVPALARELGAPRPLRVPAWVGRLAAGEYVAAQFDQFQGASNARIKRDAGWTPSYPSWRGVLGTA